MAYIFTIIFISKLVSNLCKNFFVYCLAQETYSVKDIRWSQIILSKAAIIIFIFRHGHFGCGDSPGGPLLSYFLALIIWLWVFKCFRDQMIKVNEISYRGLKISMCHTLLRWKRGRIFCTLQICPLTKIRFFFCLSKFPWAYSGLTFLYLPPKFFTVSQFPLWAVSSVYFPF